MLFVLLDEAIRSLLIVQVHACYQLNRFHPLQNYQALIGLPYPTAYCIGIQHHNDSNSTSASRTILPTQKVASANCQDDSESQLGHFLMHGGLLGILVGFLSTHA
jgi:hypothetical protein